MDCRTGRRAAQATSRRREATTGSYMISPPLPPNVLHSAGYILNGERRAKFLDLHAEANRLHTAATALRRQAWALYRNRDEECSEYS
jgi:hypothetical protein